MAKPKSAAGPSRSKADNAPDAITIKATRVALDLTQVKASIYAKSTLRSWQQWEQGHRLMHPAIWAYFLFATSPLSASAGSSSEILTLGDTDIRHTLRGIWQETHDLEQVRSALSVHYQSYSVDPLLARWSVAAALSGADRSKPTSEEVSRATKELTDLGKTIQEIGLWLSYME